MALGMRLTVDHHLLEVKVLGYRLHGLVFRVYGAEFRV